MTEYLKTAEIIFYISLYTTGSAFCFGLAAAFFGVLVDKCKEVRNKFK